MNLQHLSEACFASSIDLFHAHRDELVRDLQRRCLAATVEATGHAAAQWRAGTVVFHRSSNAAVSVGAATATGWIERVADDGSVVFRVTAVSPAGVERIDASLAFDVVPMPARRVDGSASASDAATGPARSDPPSALEHRRAPASREGLAATATAR